MPAFYELTFMPEGRTTKFAGSRGNYYEFADGARIELETTPAWCRRCCKIVHGEEIESLETIDKWLADFNDPASDDYRVMKALKGNDDLRQKAFEKLKCRRCWRESRHSPAKCIVCGSTDIFIFRPNEAICNPAGEGTVELGA